MSLTEWSIMHVNWWKHNISQASLSLVVPQNKDQIHLFCDSSTVGWGVFFPLTNSRTGGLWDIQEQSLHINVLEAKSIYIGIQIYFQHLFDSTVHIHTDNQVCLFALRLQGSTHSPWLNKYIAKIIQFLEHRKLHLVISYVRSEDNIEADTASRLYDHDLEWSVPDKIFHKICQKWGTPEIDLFASRLNHRVPLYCSWKPDPHAHAIDAFSIDWTDFNLVYIFCPYSLLTKVLKRWQDQKPNLTEGIIVAPCWKGQPWYPVLKNLSQQPPMEFHSSQLVLHHRPGQTHNIKTKILVFKL